MRNKRKRLRKLLMSRPMGRDDADELIRLGLDWDLSFNEMIRNALEWKNEHGR